MTETFTGPEVAREALSERTARRLRGALAENRIPHTELARALHLPQQTLSRKLNGQTAFTLDELELVAGVLGVDLEAILGIGASTDRPIGRCRLVHDSEVVRHQGLEPRTRWLTLCPAPEGAATGVAA